MKYALERILRYALKVISIMDQPLRKFITIHVLLRHSRDTAEVSGSCKAFSTNENLIAKIYGISIHHPQLAEQINSRLCAV